MSKTTEVAVETVSKDITVKVLEKVTAFQESGELVIPKDYSPANALKSAFLILSETLDKEKRPVLQSCTQASIANSLLTMISMGLSPQKQQIYFIPYGGKLSVMVSYLGKMAIAKRVGDVKTVNAQVIYKNDVFEYGINIEDGSLEIKKHETKLENADSDEIVGAYAIAILGNGTKRTDVMTAKQIQTSFEQSYAKGKSDVHVRFRSEMHKKTVINRLLKTVIGSSDDSNLYEEKPLPTTEELVSDEIEEFANSEVIDFEEVPEPIEAPKVEAKKETVKDLFEEPTTSAIKPEAGF
jgi:recombination protein RecT